MSLSDEIQIQIDHSLNKLPVTQECTIIKTYSDNHADLQVNGDVLHYVKIIGDNTVGSNAVLVFLEGDLNNYIAITDNEQANIDNTILALGVGKFTISNDGDLYVELPNNIENPFSIDENGDLLIELPDGATNDYEINENGDLIYDRWDV